MNNREYNQPNTQLFLQKKERRRKALEKNPGEVQEEGSSSSGERSQNDNW